jgi:plastin-1
VTDAELQAFTNYINHFLGKDPDVQGLLPKDYTKLFESLQDGVIFCKLQHLANPAAIMAEAINLPKKGQEFNVFKKRENVNLAIATARAMGCVTTNITLESIMDRREHIMLGLTWQVIEHQLLGKIELRYVPEIAVLKKEDEDVEKLFTLKPKEILLRWLNYHLRKNEKTKQVSNFTSDLKDIEAYLCVFNDISELEKEAFTYSNERRARRVMELAEKERIETFVRDEDLVQGR